MSDQSNNVLGTDLPKGVSLLPSGAYRRRFTVNGKRISKTNKSLDVLMAETNKMIQAAEDRKAVNLDKLTFDKFYSFLINEFRLRSHRTTTIMQKDSNYFSRIQPVFGNRLLESVSVFEVNKFYFDMFDEGLSTAYCNKVFGLLNEILSSAVSMHIIEFNPCSAIKMRTKSNNSGARSLSLDELRILFAKVLKDTYYCDLLKVMLLTGMRVGEAEALRFSSLEFKDDICIINVTATIGRYYSEKYNKLATYYHTPKTVSGIRKIVCFKEVYEIFLQRKKLYERFRKLKGSSWGTANVIAGNLAEDEKEITISDFIFLDKKGQPILTSNINSGIRYHIANYNRTAEHKIGMISSHDFRKTFSTLANSANVDSLILQKIMGHRDFSTTANTYIDLNIDKETLALNKFYENYGKVLFPQ